MVHGRDLATGVSAMANQAIHALLVEDNTPNTLLVREASAESLPPLALNFDFSDPNRLCSYRCLDAREGLPSP